MFTVRIRVIVMFWLICYNHFFLYLKERLIILKWLFVDVFLKNKIVLIWKSQITTIDQNIGHWNFRSYSWRQILRLAEIKTFYQFYIPEKKLKIAKLRLLFDISLTSSDLTLEKQIIRKKDMNEPILYFVWLDS